jgi:hypothetical protein
MKLKAAAAAAGTSSSSSTKGGAATPTPQHQAATALLSGTLLPTIYRTVIDDISQKFRELTKETIISARKMEESLGKLRRKREEAKSQGSASTANVSTPVTAGADNAAASATGCATTRVTNENATDRDKMVVQLYLDAHEYGSLLRPLGVNKESYVPLQSILKLCRRGNWILSGEDTPEPAEVDEAE